jgi:uncharacterized protein (DUF697 family)
MNSYTRDDGRFYQAPWRRRLLDALAELDGALDLTADAEVDYIVHATARVCARMAADPPAFADLSTLTPVRGPMAWRLADVRGLSIQEDAAVNAMGDVLHALGSCRPSVDPPFDRRASIFSGSGRLVTPDRMYATTCGISRAVDCRFVARAHGNEASADTLEEAFLTGRAEGAQKVSRTEPPTSTGSAGPPDLSEEGSAWVYSKP